MKTYIGDRNEVIVGRASGISPDGSAVMVIARTSTTYGNGVLVLRAEDGLNWTSEFLETTVAVAGCGYDPATNKVYVVDANVTGGNTLRIQISDDYGSTWTTVNSTVGTSPGTGWQALDFVAFDASNDRLVVGVNSWTNMAIGTRPIIYTNDDGATWDALYIVTEANEVMRWIAFSPESPHPIFFRHVISAGFRITMTNVNDDTTETITDFIGTDIYTTAGTTVAYSPINGVYMALLTATHPNAYCFNLATQEQPTTTVVVSGTSGSTSYVSYITWLKDEEVFFASSYGTGTNQNAYRTYKSKYGIGGWLYDPSPVYNTTNQFGKYIFYDDLRNLAQIYSHGYTTAQRIKLGYLGVAGSLPTPTPTPTPSITPSSSMAASTFDWTAIVTPSTQVWGAVAYGNFTYVALNNSTTVGMRSTDGINWTEITKPTHASNNIVYGNGVFVAFAQSGTPRIIRSVDNALTWQAASSISSVVPMRAAIYRNGKFIAFQTNGTAILQSVDGDVWTAYSTSVAGVRGVAANEDTIVTVSSILGTDPRIQYSNDEGLTWTGVPDTTSVSFNDIAYGNGRFVSITSTNEIWSSTDGISWTKISLSGFIGVGLTFGGGKFVTVGTSGTAYESTDGLSWTPSTAIANQQWVSVAFGGGKYVAVSANGTGSRAMYTLYGEQPTPTPTPTPTQTPSNTPAASPVYEALSFNQFPVNGETI